LNNTRLTPESGNMPMSRSFVNRRVWVLENNSAGDTFPRLQRT